MNARHKFQLNKWERQRVWYIDPVNGKDNRSGLTSRKAIKTFREYLDRTASDGFREYTHRVDIYLLNDLPADDPLHVHGLASKNGFLFVHGSQRIISSGHLTDAKPTDVSTVEQATIADNSRDSWEIGSLIYLPVHNAYATVVADLGEGVARITNPTQVADILGDWPFYYPSVVTLSAGDEYKVIRQTEVTHSGHISILGSGTGSDSLMGFSLIMEDLKILRPSNDHRWSYLFLNGQFNGFYRVNFNETTLSIDGTPGLYQSCIKGSESLVRTGSILHLGGSALIDSSLSIYGPFSRINDCVFQSSSVRKYTNGGQIWAGQTGFFDVDSGKSVIWLNGGTLQLGSKGIYGYGNRVPGVTLEGNATLKYSNKSQLKLEGTPDLRIGGNSEKYESATPPLEKYAGGNIPAQSPCASWEELAAEPFNGEAANYSKAAYVMKNG